MWECLFRYYPEHGFPSPLPYYRILRSTEQVYFSITLLRFPASTGYQQSDDYVWRSS